MNVRFPEVADSPGTAGIGAQPPEQDWSIGSDFGGYLRKTRRNSKRREGFLGGSPSAVVGSMGRREVKAVRRLAGEEETVLVRLG
jgi:hypothetical protein